MREILFRGKGDPKWNDGHWTYGVPMQGCGSSDWQICTDVCRATVLPETIGEYTGCKDADGNRIFEGDIISVTHEQELYDYKPNPTYTEKGLVFSDKTHYGWYVLFKAKAEALALGELDCKDIHVLGNIHDNPELF